MRPRPLLLALALTACGPKDDDRPTDSGDPATAADTDTDTDTDSDTDADADSDTDTDADTDTDSDTDTDTDTDRPEGIADVVIAVHPEMPSILVVTWMQGTACDAHLEASLDDGTLLPSPSRAYDGPARELVLGAPFDHEVTVQVVDDCGNASDPTLSRTGPLPPGAPTAIRTVHDPALQDPAMAFHLSSSDTGALPVRGWTTIVDREARTVWAWRASASRTTMQPQPSWDGRTLLIDENAFWGMLDATDSEVVEIDIEGAEVHRFATPGLHHPFAAMPDGGVAYGAGELGFLGAFDGNETLELVARDGSRRTLWDCEAWQEPLGLSRGCGSNTLRWHEDRGVFLFSFYSLETVVEVDGTTGEANRWFGHFPGAYAFDPEDAAFWWQHSAHYTADGTLLLSTKNRDAGDETWVREYEVDDGAETLREIWRFGEGEGMYGETEGEALRLPGGNVVHNYGSLPVVREATPDGTVVWEIGFPDTSAVHRSTPLTLDQLYQMRH